MDPRFACKRILSGKKDEVISEHLSGVEYHPDACSNCTITIMYHSLNGAKDISIKSVYKSKRTTPTNLEEGKSFPSLFLGMNFLKNTFVARCNSNNNNNYNNNINNVCIVLFHFTVYSIL